MQRSYFASQVRAAEAPLLAAGYPLMQEAAYAVAQHVIRWHKEAGFRVPGSTVLALAGKGNNGGDALFAAAYLARRGMSVSAAVITPAHREGMTAARCAGVKIVEDPEPEVLRKLAQAAGTWVDGLLGIGIKGAPRAQVAQWLEILKAEYVESPAPSHIVAIDIPSGVDADTGEVPALALEANVTVSMGCLKPALLLPPAAQYCGNIEVVDLGITRYLLSDLGSFSKSDSLVCSDLPVQLGSSTYLDFSIRPAVVELGAHDIADLLPRPLITDNKYKRGVLSIYAGSVQYPGAGLLCTQAAQAAGVGMIRYLGESPLVLPRCPEVVPVAGRSDAAVVGPGISDIDSLQEVLAEYLAAKIPLVLDAGGIALLYKQRIAGLRQWLGRLAGTEERALPEERVLPIILTPHVGELVRLLESYGEVVTSAEIERRPLYYARLAARYTKSVVLLKGFNTVITGMQGYTAGQGDSTARLATAGSGDVLAGILGSILAQIAATLPAEESFSEKTLVEAAAAAVFLHSEAGKIAAEDSSLFSAGGGDISRLVVERDKITGRYQPQPPCKSSIPIKASDIISAIPLLWRVI